MDLNASPHPGDDKEIFGQQLEDEPEESVVEHSERAEHIENAVDIASREREERIQRLKRQCPDDKPEYPSHPWTAYPSQPRMCESFQTKRQKPSRSSSRLVGLYCIWTGDRLHYSFQGSSR